MKQDTRSAAVIEMQEKFRLAANALFETTKLHGLIANAVGGDSLDFDSYMREIKTIAISGPRQCGRTRWMVEHCDDDSIIIVFDENNAAFLKSNFADLGVDKKRIVSYDQFMEMTNDDSELYFRQVYVDDATHIFDHESRQEFYDRVRLFANRETTIVMLG